MKELSETTSCGLNLETSMCSMDWCQSSSVQSSLWRYHHRNLACLRTNSFLWSWARTSRPSMKARVGKQSHHRKSCLWIRFRRGQVKSNICASLQRIPLPNRCLTKSSWLHPRAPNDTTRLSMMIFRSSMMMSNQKEGTAREMDQGREQRSHLSWCRAQTHSLLRCTTRCSARRELRARYFGLRITLIIFLR